MHDYVLLSTPGHPSKQSFLITEEPIKEFRDFVCHDAEMYEAILKNLFEMGVMTEQEAIETWFLCEAHTVDLIDETLNKFEDAVKASKDEKK
jgi:glutamate-1-semialdehyde aminotransferase